MKVLLEGPVLTNSGYGEHCRLVFRSIKDLPGIELSINPLNWGMTSWGSELSSERVEIDEQLDKVRDASSDRYEMIKSIYYQNRNAQLEEEYIQNLPVPKIYIE